MHSRVGRVCLARAHCSVARFESNGQRPFCMPTLLREARFSSSSSLLRLLFPLTRKQISSGKWPPSCPKWQRVVNAVSPRFSPLDSCPPLLAPPPITSLTLALIRPLTDLSLSFFLCLRDIA